MTATRTLRIGEVLVSQGVMTEQQVFEVIQAQKSKGLPFGVLAEQMFEVTIDSIERAWAEQYHFNTGTLDLDTVTIDEEMLQVINRRQAWQFQILPIRLEGTGELMIAAARDRLARAVTFAAARIPYVVFFRIAEPDQLRQYLQQHYPMGEINPVWLDRLNETSDEEPAPFTRT